MKKKIINGNLFVDNEEAENTVALQYADAMNMIFEDNNEDIVSKRSYLSNNIQNIYNSDDNYSEENQKNINDINSTKSYNKSFFH